MWRTSHAVAPTSLTACFAARLIFCIKVSPRPRAGSETGNSPRRELPAPVRNGLMVASTSVEFCGEEDGELMPFSQVASLASHAFAPPSGGGYMQLQVMLSVALPKVLT